MHRRSAAQLGGGGARAMEAREEKVKSRLCDSGPICKSGILKRISSLFFHGFFCHPFSSYHSFSPLLHSSFSLTSPPMARTSSSDALWKETPSTAMTKARLLEIANAKEARIIYLYRKYSEYYITLRRVPERPADCMLIQFNRGTESHTERRPGHARCCRGDSGHSTAHRRYAHPQAPWLQWPP